MLVIGCYPDALAPKEKASLARIGELLRPVSKQFGIHVLPPYPSSGDGGFAPNSLFDTDRRVGTWQDLVDIAKDHPLILDGIYNHVGEGHEFVRDFFANPEGSNHRILVTKRPPDHEILSPRGGSVFRRHTLLDTDWYSWQTFSKSSYDLRLADPAVQEMIRSHLNALSDLGCWGVRLDGCAYYGKLAGFDQFHNPDSILITRWVAREAKHAGLVPIAQVDSDPRGRAYAKDSGGSLETSVDYALSAHLLLALIRQQGLALSRHLRLVYSDPSHIVVGAARTHDGILLLSANFESLGRQEVAQFAYSVGGMVRQIDGRAYEVCNSLPWLIRELAVRAPSTDAAMGVLAIAALTTILPGIGYMYLPAFMGDIPEDRFRWQDLDDPRAMNRMPLSTLGPSLGSLVWPQVLDLIHAVEAWRQEHDNCVACSITTSCTDSLLWLKHDGCTLGFVWNLSKTIGVRIENSTRQDIVWSSGLNGGALAPWGSMVTFG